MKTNKKTKSFFKKAKNIPVNREFLTSFRGELSAYMEMHPPVEISKTRFFHHKPSFFTNFAIMPAFAVLFLMLITGGTTFASQNSLPGDLLYPIKILSEKMIVATSFTPESRIQKRLLIAKTRVNEASTIIEESVGSLNQNNERLHAAMGTVIDNFNMQVSANLNEADNLKKTNNPEKALQTTNDIHTATDSFNNILLDIKEKSGDETDEINRFIDSNNNWNTRTEPESSNSNSVPSVPVSGSGKKQEKNKNENSVKLIFNKASSEIAPRSNSLNNDEHRNEIINTTPPSVSSTPPVAPKTTTQPEESKPAQTSTQQTPAVVVPSVITPPNNLPSKENTSNSDNNTTKTSEISGNKESSPIENNGVKTEDNKDN